MKQKYSAEDAQNNNARFEILPEDLKDEDIDEGIRDIVRNINKSKWVWTRWSCEGHCEETDFTPVNISYERKYGDLNTNTYKVETINEIVYKWRSSPYLGIIVPTEYLAYFLKLAYFSIPRIPRKFDEKALFYSNLGIPKLKAFAIANNIEYKEGGSSDSQDFCDSYYNRTLFLHIDMDDIPNCDKYSRLCIRYYDAQEDYNNIEDYKMLKIRILGCFTELSKFVCTQKPKEIK